jgi:Fe2+ transport system protein FeoA
MNVPAPLPPGARAAASTESGPSLGDLAPGQTATVRGVRAAGELRRRLLEMGFVSGTEVRVVRRAPLRDPIEVVLHGYHLSIRHADAESILVDRS